MDSLRVEFAGVETPASVYDDENPTGYLRIKWVVSPMLGASPLRPESKMCPCNALRLT